MSISYYAKLKVWQKAMDLAVECYGLTRTFPTSETYGLSSQIRRASASVPANIAEGNGRQHRREYVQHLSIARGSLMELETHLILAQRLAYLDEMRLANLLEHAAEVSRGLTQSLKRTP